MVGHNGEYVVGGARWQTLHDAQNRYARRMMLDATLTDGRPGVTTPKEQTKQLREQAQRLIETLRRAKAETEARLDAESREDAYASVRGASSFDIAIEHAEHTRDVLDRALDRREP